MAGECVLSWRSAKEWQINVRERFIETKGFSKHNLRANKAREQIKWDERAKGKGKGNKLHVKVGKQVSTYVFQSTLSK